MLVEHGQEEDIMNQRRIFGIIIVIIGGLFLANSLNIGFDVWDILSDWWPVIIIAIGAFNLVGNGGVRTSGIIIIGVGVYFLLNSLNLINFRIDFWDILVPAIIVGVGLYMLLPKGERRANSNDYIRQMVLFSGAEINCNSQDFKGADLTALFGGMDADFRDVSVYERPAKIDVFTAFGGIDLIVPDDHSVKVKGIPLFGGWSNKANKVMTDTEADIIINAVVLFGGLEIKAKKSNLPTEEYDPNEYEDDNDGYTEM